MHVFIIEENLETYSTARKAIEKAIMDGAKDYRVFVSRNTETGKITEFPLSNVKRAIAQLRTQGYINANGANEGEAVGIVQRKVR